MLGHNGGAGRRAAGTYLVAQLVPSGGALDDDGTADGGQAALGAQVVLLAALELNASAPPRDESSESMSSSTAGRPGARRGAAGAAEGLCGAEALLPGGLSFRSPSSSDKRLSTSAILPSEHHQRARRGFANNSKSQKCGCRTFASLSHKTENPRTQPNSRDLSVSFPAGRRARRATRTSATPAGYELAGRADLAMGVGGEGVPRSPDAHAGASRPLSRSCLQRSRGRSIPAICDPLENPGSIGGSVRDT